MNKERFPPGWDEEDNDATIDVSARRMVYIVDGKRPHTGSQNVFDAQRQGPFRRRAWGALVSSQTAMNPRKR